jgi:hypothetical protein
LPLLLLLLEHLKVVAENRFIYTNLTQVEGEAMATTLRAFKWKIDPHTMSHERAYIQLAKALLLV